MATKTKAATARGAPWPADSVERRPIGDLTPYARNARIHSDEQVAQIMASIREFGWTAPVLCDENGSIIAGHGRVLAAERLKLAEVPVMVAAGWSDEQKRAYVLTDNKLTTNGGWDESILREELGELIDLGFDVSLTGFSEGEIDSLIGGEDLVSLEPGSDGSRSGVETENLTFGKHRIPLTAAELAALERLLAEHKEQFGSVFGFARRLLGGA